MNIRFASPIALLAGLLVFCLWNGHAVDLHTLRWQAQIRQADLLAQNDRWPEATTALHDSYQDWTQYQTWLHIIGERGAVDDAESMYRRAMAFSAAREPSEFRAELADLCQQLRLLAEMERLSLENIL